MKLNAELDMTMVGLESADELTVLLTLTAAELNTDVTRVPQAIQIVLDRSGSMSGERMNAAKEAITLLIQRLDEKDAFGLVAFDDEAKVIIPLRPMADHERKTLVNIVNDIETGGSTDISAGFLLGLSQAKRSPMPGGTQIIMLSDGEANEGERDPNIFRALAAKAIKAGIATSTIGIGDGYDEHILEALAAGGSGEHTFALTPDDARAAIANEVDGLLAKSALNTVLRLEPNPDVDMSPAVQLFQRMPMWMEGSTYCVQLGDLISGEERKVVLGISIPAMAALGLCEVARLHLTYTQLPDLIEHTITQPLHVNVVPGDELIGRMFNDTVLAERTMAVIQTEKEAAKEDLNNGNLDSAAARLRRSSQEIRNVSQRVVEANGPQDLIERLNSEAADFAALADTVQIHSMEIAQRTLTESFSRASRNRRRNS